MVTAQLLESVTDARVDITAFPFIGVLTFGAWSAGAVARSRAHLKARLVQQTHALERQREETARLAVDMEKVRIASDLEFGARERVADLINVAEASERTVHSDPELAYQAFAEIERSGRETLNEMRGLLGVLRSDQPRELGPPPTLAEIDSLLTQARDGGRVVEFAVDGHAQQLPAEIEVAGYRILQYLLATVIGADDHAAITVVLRYTPQNLSLEVTGGTFDEDSQEALLAARERASVHAGTVTVEHATHDRRLLRALLPVAVTHAVDALRPGPATPPRRRGRTRSSGPPSPWCRCSMRCHSTTLQPLRHFIAVAAGAGAGLCGRHPVTAALGIAALVAASALPGVADAAPDTSFLAPVAASYATASRAGARGATTGLIALIASEEVVNLRSGGWVPALYISIGPWIAGRIARSGRNLIRKLESRTRELDLEREAFSALAVRRERARIAYDLHDIVSHHMAVVVVQAARLESRQPKTVPV